MIEIRQAGNLLRENVEALVNTVNCVGVMGKGIALQFKQAYPENFSAYKKACARHEVKTGRMFVFATGALFGVKYIINFPTKDHWKERSRIEYIEEGLSDLQRVVRENGICSIAVPPLGCGNGGLDWERVKPLILRSFAELSDIRLILYEPVGAPKPDMLPIRTTEPKMTPGRAALLGLLRQYEIPGYDLTLLEIQKLMFFLQEMGEPLRLNYVKQKYGPYANNLNHVLQALDGHYITGYGDRSRQASIRVIPERFGETDVFLRQHPETEQRFEKVKNLISGYETPYGLELLATVYWVVHKEKIRDESEIIKSIQSWNERKKMLFKKEHILKALTKLRVAGVLEK
ncbi:O-acetyl-ADP-ribose deacetylase (regulator of RNase III) [Hydrogenispora ethanolica]|jgi:O-acetyl-ADP-ribose deacetylase (regulator of RNase III)|uniref:O-acetyl-ADP-ribose deacetylase (Regulator of RNase III) n=1 Tax=Hydrogenispora ethanolica TaxID=1082276 RepID=A0A4R1SBT9_HYDET|nr:macro domain-containing protein [Hydrogenispora ethanolica]TCL76889.1 O-acetyl-ADP-ribose deacetylase (regulator of RNase III) [Hydrogenispora ethanolica]